MTFKEAIYKVLLEVGHPLDAREITRLALEKGYLKTAGKTPHSTAHAQIAVDIKNKGEKSRFKRVAPGVFALRDWAAKPIKDEIPDWQITPNLSPKQKGDMAENRVAELIQLYGEASLSCYKPTSDDEGIDLIVKRKGATLQSHYIQIKSRFLKPGQTFIQTPAADFILNSYHMSLVFVLFDTTEGDIGDYLWFIPAPDFIREAPVIPANKAKNRKRRYRFNASIKNPTEGKWGEYAINKQALADAIVELMKKVK